MYEIGQRVELIIDHPDNNQSLVRGDTGTVVKVYGDGATQSIGVQWDKYVSGHDCTSDTCLGGHGWLVFCTDIVPEDVEIECDDLAFQDFMKGISLQEQEKENVHSRAES